MRRDYKLKWAAEIRRESPGIAAVIFADAF
jgi:hypothetical protein